ncbi:MAG: aldehyde ferredoxin oxidoreductase family protein [Candidatus Helarchaeota archaeon]
MAKITGYTGKLIRVNLSSSDIKIEDLDIDIARDYIGGSGFGIRYIYDEVPPETDPLSEQNKICFFTGPFVGTTAPSAGRYMVAAKSPLTGIFGEACSGGYWGPELKFAGFDGIIVEGKAEDPRYMWIHDGEVELKSAKDLWGKDTFETESMIKKELNDEKIVISGIGPAGEKLIKMAAIINDRGRAAGRTGMGAVMGSKNLKAIACRGTDQNIEIANESLIKKASRSVFSKINTNILVTSIRSYGTPWFLDVFWIIGDIPFKNWGWSVHDWAEKKGVEPYTLTQKLAGSSIRKNLKKRIYACYGCAIACGCEIEVPEGAYKCSGHQPEYETLAMFGTNCLNDNLESVCKCNDICNRYGLDTISVGSTISFAMDLYEQGIITKEDIGGIDLTWGNHEAIVKLTEKIAKNENIGKLGNILSEGTKSAAEKIGKNAMDYAVQVKGLEAPAHDPRAFVSMGIQYATSNRGACHVNALPSAVDQGIIFPLLGIPYKTNRFVNKNKGVITKKMQEVFAIFNSLIICQFAGLAYGANDTCQLLKGTTGFEFDFKDLIYKIGGRINTLKRIYNIRCGISGKDDVLPKKLMTPVKTGSTADIVPDIETQKEEFYKENKWDHNGYPTMERLKELGLEKEAKYILK